jgi:hypothetical protein
VVGFAVAGVFIDIPIVSNYAFWFVIAAFMIRLMVVIPDNVPHRIGVPSETRGPTAGTSFAEAAPAMDMSATFGNRQGSPLKGSGMHRRVRPAADQVKRFYLNQAGGRAGMSSRAECIARYTSFGPQQRS